MECDNDGSMGNAKMGTLDHEPSKDTYSGYVDAGEPDHIEYKTENGEQNKLSIRLGQNEKELSFETEDNVTDSANKEVAGKNIENKTETGEPDKLLVRSGHYETELSCETEDKIAGATSNVTDNPNTEVAGENIENETETGEPNTPSVRSGYDEKEIFCKTEDKIAGATANEMVSATTEHVSGKIIEDGTETESDTTGDDFTHPFSKQTLRDDLTLIVEGRKFYVSSVVLGLISPVLSKRFEEGKLDSLEIHNSTFDSMLEFLCCIYPNIRKPLTMENIQSVMGLAVEFQVNSILSEAEELIKKKLAVENTCQDFLQLAMICRQCGMKKFEDQCWKAIERKDVSEIEKIELGGNVADLPIEMFRIQSTKYKKALADYNTQKNENDYYKAQFNYFRLFIKKQEEDDTYGFNAERITFDGKTGKISDRSPFVSNGLDEVIEDISIVGFCRSLRVKVEIDSSFLKHELNGVLILRNFIDDKKSRDFPFTRDDHSHSMKIKTDVQWSELNKVGSGFLHDGKGELAILYKWSE